MNMINPQTDNVIAINNLTLGYDRHPAVHHLAAELCPGSLTAIVGPNGAGKSTLLKGIVGALRPQEGSISTGSVKRRDIAYLPQQAEIDREFPIGVSDFVAMGLWRRVGLFGGIGKRMRHRIEEAVAAVGLSGYEGRPIGSLSGGQMQRAMFARLLLQDAQIVLLDEPFNAIDTKTVTDLLELVKHWHGERRTILTVLHDMEHVRRHFPDTLLLARELIAHGPTKDVLTAENLLLARQRCETFDENAAVCHVHPDHVQPDHEHTGHEHAGHEHAGHEYEHTSPQRAA